MNISNQEIKDLYSIQKDGSAWSLRISIENPQLAYHYRYYKALRDEDILLELEISGFRHDDHNPKAIEFRDGVGVPSLVRLLMASDDSQGGRRIRKVQLIPRFQLPETGAVSALEEPSESLAGPDWGGRYNADAGLWTDWTFEPGQWNDCGKTDDRWRQFLCILEDLGMDCVGFIVACVLGGLVIMVILALMCWRLFKISRKSFREKEKRQEERDALLLSGDEDLDELSLKDEEEKAIARALSSNPPIVAEENEDEIDNSGDWRFGPFQQNLGDGV